ncbi:conserved Plasmodium protein, unknown function [Plasmodium gallinaceum]|uniref:Uncharacterized protein n=1 Tax=Plasmodium gallinaceum TaxID=5849 RepID=A0A1J1GUI5_PLAGA|nr:conserved Plasmodium protein, unknown function [Plasmodium gallinaceum]CRG96122.1 conserved Plasmodium protein, unknown function [Plasmodium gallinaceum]
MKTSKDLCKFFCKKCNNFIFYKEACDLIFEKIYPQYSKLYYNKYVLDKKKVNENNVKIYDNLYRQIYSNGLCGVNKQRNCFLNKDNIYNILSYLNKGNIECKKCNKINMWYIK